MRIGDMPGSLAFAREIAGMIRHSLREHVAISSLHEM